jgi:Zn-dependent protease
VLFRLFGNGWGWEDLILVLVFALALLCAIISHEVAHGLAALKMGDASAKLAGRLSLNPAKHIEPVGLLCFCLVGIGWAKPVPVNPFNYKNFRRGNFWVSIAGVVTNLIIGFLASLFLFLVYRYANTNNLGFFALFYFFYFCTAINISLMVFNLLPIYPLDGFNMLVSFTRPDNRYMQFMRRNSMWVLLCVMTALIFTRALGYAADGIADGFIAFWGLIF